MPYRLGGNGSDATIDCIHLVYEVLHDLGIPTPAFRQSWYEYPWVDIYRHLLRWGKQVERPTYDGDVCLLGSEALVFGVAWQSGILCISQQAQRVVWCPIAAVEVSRTFRHCSHTRET